MIKIRKWLLVLTLGLFFTGPSVCYSQAEKSEKAETTYLQKHIPSNLQGCLDTLVHAALYPVFYLFGVDGLLIFIPSKYPNGEVRSHGG